MIWLASYPRSGNTFLRIVLSEVYGIESSTFHLETDYPVDPEYDTYPVVKTHLLPHQLVPDDPKIPAVYLMRDGRDCIVSMAHQKKDLIDPDSDIYENIYEAIVAAEGTFFGGWSQNVEHWLARAEIVIKFEDLIDDPIKTVEQFRQIMALPKPNLEKLPTFHSLKAKDHQYGSGVSHGFSSYERQERRQRFFRRGKVGAWKDEMPDELLDLYWERHGETMNRVGYKKWDSLFTSRRIRKFILGNVFNPYTNTVEAQRTTKPKSVSDTFKKKILIEASKMAERHMDGGKRYTAGLLKGLQSISEQWKDEFDIYITVDGFITELIETSSQFQSKELQSKTLQIEPPLWGKAWRYLVETRGAFLLNLKKRFPKFWDFAKKRKDTLIHKQYSNFDLIHISIPQIYQRFESIQTKYVMTIHDFTHLYLPDFHMDENVANASKGIRFAIERDASFIAVSNSTKKDMLSEHSVSDNRIYRVYEACDTDMFQVIKDPDQFNNVREKYSLPDKPYLLSLSTLEPRKNLLNTLKAFLNLLKEEGDLDMIFIIAGKRGWMYDSLFDDPSIQSDRVVFSGYIADEDLATIYSHAYAFCFVSHYEGFGLPALEAMSCGVPVIYGDNSSMPEIVGKGGLPANPDDIEDIKAKMKRMLTDEKMRNETAQIALENSMKFSWSKAAEETIEVYRNMLSD